MSRIRLIVLREEGDNRPLTQSEWNNMIKQLEEQQRALTVHMRDDFAVVNLDLSGRPTSYEKFIEYARGCPADTTIDSLTETRLYKMYYYSLGAAGKATLTQSLNTLSRAGLKTIGEIRSNNIEKLHDIDSLGKAHIELLTKIFDLH